MRSLTLAVLGLGLAASCCETTCPTEREKSLPDCCLSEAPREHAVHAPRPVQPLSLSAHAFAVSARAERRPSRRAARSMLAASPAAGARAPPSRPA